MFDPHAIPPRDPSYLSNLSSRDDDSPTEAPEYAGSGLTVVPVAMYPDVYRSPSIGGRWGSAVPLTLEPRQEAGVEMQVTVSRCMDQGALTRWNDVPVTFKVFGIERHVFAQMNVQIDLVGTQSDC